MIAEGIKKAIRNQFAFATKNGAGDLSIGGHTVRVLIVEPPTTEAENRPGRKRAIRRAIVGALKDDIPLAPAAGTRANLDGWNCVVSEDGLEEDGFCWRINLRSA